MAEFNWDEHNKQHVQEHGVEPWEAEDALRDPDALAADAYNQDGETRWAALGATEDGRLLFVVFTRRAALIRVITAGPATPRQTRRYRRTQK